MKTKKRQLELTDREQSYLKRYKAGTMTIKDFDRYMEKGLIRKEFYDYILSL